MLRKIAPSWTPDDRLAHSVGPAPPCPDVRACRSSSSPRCSRVATRLRHPRRLSGAVPASSLRCAPLQMLPRPFALMPRSARGQSVFASNEWALMPCALITDPHPRSRARAIDCHTRERGEVRSAEPPPPSHSRGVRTPGPPPGGHFVPKSHFVPNSHFVPFCPDWESY